MSRKPGAKPKAELLWLDMEMTGLEVSRERPIEVAAIVTDWDLEPIAEYHAIIQQPKSLLDAMDAWNTEHHGKSGLLAAIPLGLDMAVVDRELAEFTKTHFPKERAILAGNSITQDRLFIRAYLPLFESTLHYRMMDVTAWKVIFNGRYGQRFKKTEGHRALDDIRESINELKFYLDFVKP